MNSHRQFVHFARKKHFGFCGNCGIIIIPQLRLNFQKIKLTNRLCILIHLAMNFTKEADNFIVNDTSIKFRPILHINLLVVEHDVPY